MSVIISSKSLLPVRRDKQTVTNVNITGGGGAFGGSGSLPPAYVSIINGTPVAGQIAVFHDASSIEGGILILKTSELNVIYYDENTGIASYGTLPWYEDSDYLKTTGNNIKGVYLGSDGFRIGYVGANPSYWEISVPDPGAGLSRLDVTVEQLYLTALSVYFGDGTGDAYWRGVAKTGANEVSFHIEAPNASGVAGQNWTGGNIILQPGAGYGTGLRGYIALTALKIQLGFGLNGYDVVIQMQDCAGANAPSLTIKGSNALQTGGPPTGDYNGGALILQGGDKAGTGTDGSVFIGGTTNSVKIAKDGEMTFEGTATVWDDLRILPSAFDFAGGTDPAIVNWQPGGSGTTFKVWEFQLDDQGYFTCQMPHSYKQGSDIYCHVHWTPGTRGNEENGNAVAWKLDYSWANIGGVFGASATIDMTDACNGTDHEHNMTPEATIDGHTAAKNVSSMLVCRIYRHDVAGDTWSGTASGQLPILLEVDFHYEMDSVGSKLQGSK
jgi:hypothetical protein